MNMNTSWLLAPVLCAVTSTCSASDSTPGGQKPASTATVQHAAHVEVPAAPSSLSLSQVLKKGMAYADLRMAALNHGWVPAPDATCKAKVVGADYQKQCANSPELCKPCEEMPELSECSGDAVCVMHFRHPGQNTTLEVVTYGDIDQWNVQGQSSQLNVTGWTIKPEKALQH